jgi:DNA-directed RNA polymerase beta' subunit
MLAKLVHTVNNDELKMFRKSKPKNTCLFDIQVNFNNLYTEQINIMATKKGELRQNFGGRFNFSARCVIAQEPSLEVDSVKLPYFALVELLKPTIINILKKSYNITYSEAYKIWYKSQINTDMRVWSIIEQFITDKGHIPILINRN